MRLDALLARIPSRAEYHCQGDLGQVDWHWWWVGPLTVALLRDPAEQSPRLEVWRVDHRPPGLGVGLQHPRVTLQRVPGAEVLHWWWGLDAVLVGLDLLDERAGDWS